MSSDVAKGTTGQRGREGQGTTAAPATGADRAVRLGVVAGGRLVEERTVRAGRDVTVGPSARDTIIASLAPSVTAGSPSLRLLAHTPAGYVLEARPGMRGRVVIGGEDGRERAISVEEVARARRIGLGAKARGRVVVGDTTILFQLVAPPPVVARPVLPPSLRGSIFANLDWALVGVVALSLFAHLGFVVYLKERDEPRRPSIEDIPDRFVSAVMKIPRLPTPPRPAPKEEPKPTAVFREGPYVDGPAVVHRTPRPRPPVAAPSDLRATVGQMGLLRVIGSLGEHGEIANLLESGAPDSDADRALRDVGGVGVASASPRLAPRGHAEVGGRRDIHDLAGPRVAIVDVGGAHEADTGQLVLPRRVLLDDPRPGCDPDRVAHELAQRKRAVLACYERVIKHDPSATGKIELHLRVSPAGLVTDASIGDDGVGSAELASCITRTASGWRFPALGCGDVEFSCPFVFQRSQ